MAQEIKPQVKAAPPVFRDAGTRYQAIPVCRSCAEHYELTPGTLLAFPMQHGCEVKHCENKASYLHVC